MAKSILKPSNPFAVRWRITSMSAWDEEFIDEEEEANRCGGSGHSSSAPIIPPATTRTVAMRSCANAICMDSLPSGHLLRVRTSPRTRPAPPHR
jgi:hypothetical protein